MLCLTFNANYDLKPGCVFLHMLIEGYQNLDDWLHLDFKCIFTCCRIKSGRLTYARRFWCLGKRYICTNDGVRHSVRLITCSSFSCTKTGTLITNTISSLPRKSPIPWYAFIAMTFEYPFLNTFNILTSLAI